MGAANTNAIIARMEAGSVTTTAYAAGLARGYTNNGFTDWFLPSQDELNAMCNYSRNPTTPAAPTVVCGTSGIPTSQNSAFNSGGVFADFGFAAGLYWSSSQNSPGGAWSRNFVNGNQNYGVKSPTNSIRPVRAF
jgi:type II secretory pathway pseudopilin PulG